MSDSPRGVTAHVPTDGVRARDTDRDGRGRTKKEARTAWPSSPRASLHKRFVYIKGKRTQKKSGSALFWPAGAIFAAGELRFRVRHGYGHVLPAIAAAW